MDDMMGKISEILSDKESMEQIKQLADMLGMGPSSAAPPPAKPPPTQADSGGDLGFDFGMLMQLQSVMQTAGAGDINSDLLMALRPHLSSERQQKVDKAIKILRIFAVVSVVKEAGLLDKLDLF